MKQVSKPVVKKAAAKPVAKEAKPKLSAEELREIKRKAGRAGGLATRRRHGPEYYSKLSKQRSVFANGHTGKKVE